LISKTAISGKKSHHNVAFEENCPFSKKIPSEQNITLTPDLHKIHQWFFKVILKIKTITH
jgi:hypothetical protein